MPQSKHKVFYYALPVLHALGAILSLSLSFACDTGRGKQTARVPRAYPLPPSLAPDAAFLASYPWDEGEAFRTHEWNPFALIFVFEWLTAAFALRPLVYFVRRPALVAQARLAWLGLGLCLYFAYAFTNSGGPCVAMTCTVVASFLGTIALTLFDHVALAGYSLQGVSKHDETVSLSGEHHLDTATGRIWLIPQNLRKRARYPLSSLLDADEQDDSQQQAVDTEYENAYGVILRYAEYCITAPLLFLAVVCLLTSDAPAWLFLSGYWLLVVCNATGIALHAGFVSVPSSDTPRTSLFFVGAWKSQESNMLFLLQTAWVSLLVPFGGLVFITRQFLLSSDMPALALVMIWNLLVTYSMFGIVPTVVYLTHWGARYLAWLLDILNVSAKFPLPLIILIGFVTRPATTRFCYN